MGNICTLFQTRYLTIKSDNLKSIFTGKSIYKKDILEDKGWKIGEIVCVFCGDKFIGMYKIFRGREIFAKPGFVMQSTGKQLLAKHL